MTKKDSSKNSKTFKAEMTKGLSKDIENIKEDLDVNNTEFLKILTDMAHSYAGFWDRMQDQYDEFGVYLDKRLGLYKATRIKNPTAAEKLQAKTFMLGIWLSNLTKDEKKKYMELLFSKGLDPKDIYKIMWEEQE